MQKPNVALWLQYNGEGADLWIELSWLSDICIVWL
jgi:hypothetical protein